MMYFNTIAKTFSARLVLLVAVLLGNAALAMAANKVTIQDFSIKAGETKEVAVELTSDAADVYRLEGTISVPSGLELVANAYGTNVHAKSTSRANGNRAQLNPLTGKFSIIGTTANPFSGTSGAIMTIKVKASENFSKGTITYSGILLNGSIQGSSSATKVTLEQGGINPDDPQPGPEPGDNTLSFAQSTVKLMAGESTTLQLELENGDEFTGIEGYIAAGNGITITGVQKTSRLFGQFGYNANSGRFQLLGTIDGNSGAILNISIKADDDFAGNAAVSVNNVKVTTASSVSTALNSAQAVVTAVIPDAPYMALTFNEDEVTLGAGNSIDVPVYAISNVSLTAFMAKLVLPAGISAEVKKGALISKNPSFNANNGNIQYMGSVEDGEGSLFILTLTADEDFKEDAELSLTNITGSSSNATTGLHAEDITLTIKAKDEASYQQALDIVNQLRKQLADKIAEIEDEYPAAADDEVLIDEEEVIDDEIDELENKIDEHFANNDLDLDKVAEVADAISAEIEDLEATAKALQDNADGYAKLKAELDDLRQRLADAMDQRPNDLPKSVNEGFEDTADDIVAAIDALEDALKEAYKKGELTAVIDLDEFAPEEKQAIIDAIKALEAEILTWLRGDVAQNQKVEMPDFYALADSILNENLPTDKEGNAFYRFDANADDEINVGDMQGIVNIVLGMDAYGNASRQAEAVEAKLSVESAKIGNITRYTLNLTGMEYTAFQMDVNGRVAAETADGMTLRTADLKSGARRVLGFGAAKSDGTVLYIDVEGQAQFSNIVFTTGDARTVKFNLGNATGISTVKSAAASGQAYDLGGRAVKNAKGVVIIDGKKVIR